MMTKKENHFSLKYFELFTLGDYKPIYWVLRV